MYNGAVTLEIAWEFNRLNTELTQVMINLDSSWLGYNTQLFAQMLV